MTADGKRARANFAAFPLISNKRKVCSPPQGKP
ncbi:MAG TPA: hypothetical protein [Caudoviricetes sp.]|nr:MAG TPA: hypothetical protein [Caudoviricetes sp.]